MNNAIDRQRFIRFFWPLYPSDQDWDNWKDAGKPALMVTLDMLRSPSGPDFIQDLIDAKVPGVAIRVQEPDIYHISPSDIRDQVAGALAAGLPRDPDNRVIVVLGNEPEAGIPWHYKRPEDPPDFNWGQAFAYYHAERIKFHNRALKGRGIGDVKLGEPLPVRALAPGWICRDIWEDGELAPGFYTWRDIVRDSGYWELDGFSLHSYTAYGNEPEDPIRHKNRLKQFLNAFHFGPAFYGEFGVLAVPDPARMRFYIRYAEHIRTHPVYGSRVLGFTPFTPVGNPYIDPGDPSKGTHWDPRYLITNREAYQRIGDYITRGVIPEA